MLLLFVYYNSIVTYKS